MDRTTFDFTVRPDTYPTVTVLVDEVILPNGEVVRDAECAFDATSQYGGTSCSSCRWDTLHFATVRVFPLHPDQIARGVKKDEPIKTCRNCAGTGHEPRPRIAEGGRRYSVLREPGV
jgi:hypothetical protein